jgi:hypothetical protein
LTDASQRSWLLILATGTAGFWISLLFGATLAMMVFMCATVMTLGVLMVFQIGRKGGKRTSVPQRRKSDNYIYNK